MAGFLPVSREELQERGIGQPDFVYVVGDAYVDHPSFGMAIISRVLEARGYSVGIIAQPDYRRPESIDVFGRPRLAFLVSAGNMDSLVNHYTVAKKRRQNDFYSPGGKPGRRPDRAVTVYCNMIRQVYRDVPIVIGGIEASLRRLAHYDYWSDKVRRSVLLESGADLLSYGMGEKSITEIADALDSGLAVRDITFIRGTVFKTRNESLAGIGEKDTVVLPSFEEVSEQGEKYAQSVGLQYANTDAFSAKRLVETYGGKTFVVQNPPAYPLTTMEMDDVYALPYMRAAHPMYDSEGGVPAIREVKFSLTSNRGCFGGCSFCALTFHEGRIVQARSHESILTEAEQMIRDPDFKGYIHDVGGPTAEFRKPACQAQLKRGACVHRQCLFPKPCPNLEVDHSDYLALLRKLRALPGVKKVFVRSGIRFDYLMADKDKTFLRELCEHHVSGQLRVAPEHISDPVLTLMGKPPVQVYNAFIREFEKTNEKLGLQQYAVPYLMSSHPGSKLSDAVALAVYLHKEKLDPDQVQDFYPTPGTISTCMYWTGIDPRNGHKVYVARNPHEKAMQRALIQYRRPENYDLVKEALLEAGREDLIGFGKECLIPPRKIDPGTREKKRQAAGGKTAAGKGRTGEKRPQERHAHRPQEERSQERKKNGKKNGGRPAGSGRR